MSKQKKNSLCFFSAETSRKPAETLQIRRSELLKPNTNLQISNRN